MKTFDEHLKSIEQEDSREIFKKGDVVLLKSGGQLMTVEHFGPVSQEDGAEGLARCLWHNHEWVICSYVFDSECLDNVTVASEIMAGIEEDDDQEVVEDGFYNFTGAMQSLEEDLIVARKSWTDGQMIRMVERNGTDAIVAITSADVDETMGWFASSEDLLATDWMVVA